MILTLNRPCRKSHYSSHFPESGEGKGFSPREVGCIIALSTGVDRMIAGRG